MKKQMFVGLLVIIALFMALLAGAYAELPRDFQDFKARYDKEARTPEGAVHLYFEAVFCYLDEGTRPEASKMLRYALHQSAPIENTGTLRRFVERMKDESYHYIFRSFAVGATPENNYDMSPDDFELEYISKSKQGSDTQLLIHNGGADSPRSVRVRQYDGLWYMSSNSNTYVDVRPLSDGDTDALRELEEASRNESGKQAPVDGKNKIEGIWHNGEKTWAYNYHTVFNKDGTVEHFGHRNMDKGTYTIENDGAIRAIFNDCKYDFPGEGYLKVSGYTCTYRFSDDGKELSRDCNRDDSVSDNDNYRPLQRTNDFVESSEF